MMSCVVRDIEAQYYHDFFAKSRELFGFSSGN